MSLPAIEEILTHVIDRDVSFEKLKPCPIEINIALIGAGSGKTSFLKSLLGKKFSPVYYHTEASYIGNRYRITYDHVKTFVFYEFSSVERYMYYPYNDYNFVEFDIIALMIDKNRSSYAYTKEWFNKLLEKNPQSKKIIIKNKIDQNIPDANINIKGTYDISVKKNQGIDFLLKKLAN
jgi:GTPase SAR1 family protein